MRTIAVGLDGSEGSIHALKWANQFALKHHATLRVIGAWQYPVAATMPGIIGAVPISLEMDTATADSLQTMVDEHVTVDYDISIGQGSPATVLMSESAADDLLVVGSRGLGPIRGLGSCSRHCTIHSTVPVVVIGEEVEPLGDHPKIIVAVDGSDRSIAALTWTLKWASPGATIKAVYSHNESQLTEPFMAPADRHELDIIAVETLRTSVQAAKNAAQSDRDVEELVRDGDPRVTIIGLAQGADMLITGNRGHSGIVGLLLGSFATHAVLQSNKTAVAVFHGELEK